MFRLRHRKMFLQRGQFKYTVLRTLKERPMHGYEVMQTIGQFYKGWYLPSPGIIYPTLQMLQDQGYIRGEDREGKRVYSLTSEGLRFLEEGEKNFEEGIGSGKQFFEVRAALRQEFHTFARLMVEKYHDLTPEKVEKIRQILKETNEKIATVIEE